MWVASRRPCAWKTLGSFEALKEKVAHISHLRPAQVGTVGARSKGSGMRIAQRVTRSGSTMALSLDHDGGNHREFAEKRSGVLQWIHPVSWLRRPHTVSGSRTEPAGGHKLERVCDLRFFVVRLTRPSRLAVGGVAWRSPG